MLPLAEPEIKKHNKPEYKFQEAILHAIDETLKNEKKKSLISNYFILTSFGLDIAVFIEKHNTYNLRLLELKAFVGSRPGGVGISNGPQMDLLDHEYEQLAIANKFIRWVLVDGTMNTGEKRYVFFDSIGAKDNVYGGIKRDKQNNLKLTRLRESVISWDELLNKIFAFLLT